MEEGGDQPRKRTRYQHIQLPEDSPVHWHTYGFHMGSDKPFLRNGYFKTYVEAERSAFKTRMDDHHFAMLDHYVAPCACFDDECNKLYK